MVVNPGGITGCHSVYTWPVGGSTGITPAHNACEVPDASHWTGEWASRITLAGIFAPLHIAGTHHVLLDKVGLLGLGSDVVEAIACPTTNEWNLKLL